MSGFAEALRHLQSRAAEQPTSLATEIARRTVAESTEELPLESPLTIDYVFESDIPSEPVIFDRIEPTASATLFTDPSFNQAMAFADAAIEAVDEVVRIDGPFQADETFQTDETENWPTAEISSPPPSVVGRASESRAETNGGGLLASVAIDRSYGRFWDNLTATLLQSPPWAIAVADIDCRQEPTWMLPMAVAFAQRHPGQVLLVDGAANRGSTLRDSSGGGLEALSGLACRFGLAEVLQASVDWRDAVESTATPRIGLLASGDFANLGDSSVKMNDANLIEELKSSYQLILIRVGNARDARIAPLVRASDGALLMFELGRTSHVAAEKASSALYLSGARLLGCIARG